MSVLNVHLKFLFDELAQPCMYGHITKFYCFITETCRVLPSELTEFKFPWCGHNITSQLLGCAAQTAATTTAKWTKTFHTSWKALWTPYTS